MNLDKIISTLQGNIARRGVEIADLETLYNIRKATAYTKRQYEIVRAVRVEIKPLAQSQKFDRTVLRELNDKHSRRQQKTDTIVVQSFPFPFTIFDDAATVDIIQSNKFSFPG